MPPRRSDVWSGPPESPLVDREGWPPAQIIREYLPDTSLLEGLEEVEHQRWRVRRPDPASIPGHEIAAERQRRRRLTVEWELDVPGGSLGWAGPPRRGSPRRVRPVDPLGQQVAAGF